jgi:hypothetical protein
MFDFSTETILNSIANAAIVTDAADPTLPTGEVLLHIKRLGKFYQDDSVTKRKTVSMYKRAGSAPVNEIATIAAASLVPATYVGKVIRLSIDVRLSGSEMGDYSRWAVNKGQPFFAEFYVGTTYGSATLMVAAMATAFNKALKKGTNSQYTQLVVSASTTNLVVTATNEHQRFDSVKLELIDSAIDDLPVDLLVGTVTTAGKEGFGTAWYLTKNTRLPTVEQLRFQGLHQDELPVAGTIYTQYTLVVEAERDITTHVLVGSKSTSKTHHVIFVPAANVAAFDALLAQIGTVTTVS